MRPKLSLALILTLGTYLTVTGQVSIDNVRPLTTFSNDTIVITGAGFNATPANLDVWFGAVKGTVISSSEFAIEVKVPAQARLTNIEVVNKFLNLSARANVKFMPSLKTEAFNVSKFTQVAEFTAPQELFDLCVCDLNTDGKPDITATKFQRAANVYQAAQDLMLLQNNSTPGTMAFTKVTPLPAAMNLTFPTDNIVCGDLNADGKSDLVVSRAGSTRNSIHVLRNNGVGGSGSTISFAPQVAFQLPVGEAATRLAIRDLNKDGKPEIIVTSSTSDFFYIFINQSTGGTLVINATPIKLDIDPAGTGLRTYEPEVQDFNNDGLPDIIVNRFVENNFYIFKNQSTPGSTISFAAPVEHVTADSRDFNRIGSADFNNDGKLDLVFTNTNAIPGNQISAIYLNQSSGGNISFASDASAIPLTTSIGTWGVDVNDIDGDKDIDFILGNRDANVMNAFIHNGNFANPGFTRVDIPTTTATAPWTTRNIKIGDLDGDGKPDIAFVGQSDNSLPAVTAVEILQNTLCHQPEIQNDLPPAGPLTICNGQSIVLKSIQANNVNYEWRKDPAGANTLVGTNSPFLTITTPGTYRVTNTSNGCNLFDEIVVTFDPGGAPVDPAITANTPLCVGAILNLSTPAVPTASYTWTKPNGSTITTQNPSFAVGLDDAGIYKLQVTVGVCKSDITTKRIDVASLANFAVTSNPTNNMVCQGSTIQLSVNSLANHTYQWKKDGSNIIGQTTTNLSVNQEGSYSVVVTNTTLNCNTETAPVQAVILTTPVANYSVKSPACTSEVITFNNQSTVDSRATAVYDWNFGDGNTSTSTSPTKSYSGAQTFNTSLTVSYSGVSGAGCSHNITKPVVITASVQPTITSPVTGLCPDETTTLSITGTFSSILWSNNATTLTTDVSGPATYTVSTTDANGCPGQDDIIINAKAVPTLTVTADPATIPNGGTSQLLASGADTYAWLPIETLSNPAIANPIASPLQTTTYSVTGSLTGGCSAQGEVIVTVRGILGFPVAFSPNGDGINDIWNIRAQDKPDCTLNVFDDKGRRIYEARGENWDGTFQGKAVPDGTYYYVFGCPGEKPITGNVLIIR